MTEEEKSLRERIDAFASTISRQPLGLALHRPETWAEPSRCFENVWEKMRRDGGTILFGWTFHHRIAQGTGEYLFVTHHAVWHASNGALINVTPFHQDSKHHPIRQEDGIVFLVDDAAQPVETGNVIAPLPFKFWPLGDSGKIVRYVEKLNLEEQLKCRDIYEGHQGE